MGPRAHHFRGMSRITDELDAGTERDEAPPGRVAFASGAAGMTPRAIAELAAGASALDVVLGVLDRDAPEGAREVRIVAFDRSNGARSHVGPLAGLGADGIPWQRPVEATFRGHEVFFPAGAGAEPMALGLALASELAPAEEDDEAASLASCVAAARRALAARPGEPHEALYEPDVLDALLDAIDESPAPPALARVADGVGVVAVDADGGMCVASVGDAPAPPMVALRFGRAFVGVAGPGGAEAIVLPRGRAIDRAVPSAALLDGLAAFGPGDLALVVREDEGGLEARADGRGEGAAAVQVVGGSTSAHA